MNKYKHEKITMLNMDCVEYMETVPTKYFDLAIVDPPYGIGEDGSKNHSRSKLAKSRKYTAYSGNDLTPPTAEYFSQLMRVSKNQIIFGANHYISNMPYDSSCWIVWDKQNGETDFADCELAWTSFRTAVRKFTWRWHGMLQQNMKNKQIRIHPNEKPIALYVWLLLNYAKPGDKILDTHGGSFSSAIACHKHGFEFVGTELDAEYYNLAVDRFKTYASQLDLFSKGA